MQEDKRKTEQKKDKYMQLVLQIILYFILQNLHFGLDANSILLSQCPYSVQRQ